MNNNRIGNNNISQMVYGNKNVLVNGKYVVTNYEIENNIEFSEFRIFEKVLYSVPPERFLEDILQPYLNQVMPDASISEFKKLVNR